MIGHSELFYGLTSTLTSNIELNGLELARLGDDLRSLDLHIEHCKITLKDSQRVLSLVDSQNLVPSIW
jgi:hypothetical protein